MENIFALALAFGLSFVITYFLLYLHQSRFHVEKDYSLILDFEPRNIQFSNCGTMMLTWNRTSIEIIHLKNQMKTYHWNVSEGTIQHATFSNDGKSIVYLLNTRIPLLNDVVVQQFIHGKQKSNRYPCPKGAYNKGFKIVDNQIILFGSTCLFRFSLLNKPQKQRAQNMTIEFKPQIQDQSQYLFQKMLQAPGGEILKPFMDFRYIICSDIVPEVTMLCVYPIEILGSSTHVVLCKKEDQFFLLLGNVSEKDKLIIYYRFMADEKTVKALQNKNFLYAFQPFQNGFIAMEWQSNILYYYELEDDGFVERFSYCLKKHPVDVQCSKNNIAFVEDKTIDIISVKQN